MNEHIITDNLLRKDVERITYGVNLRTILRFVWNNWKPIKKVSARLHPLKMNAHRIMYNKTSKVPDI
jgi:hypothetical protein